MRAFTLLFVLLAQTSFAQYHGVHLTRNTWCGFETENFVVESYSSTYREPIQKNATKVACDAGWDIAAGFDGVDFKVFNSQTRFFTSQPLLDASDKDYANYAQVAAGDKLAAVYTGKDFAVYDSTRQFVLTNFANMASPDARLSAGETVAILYDGSDIQVYNKNTMMFDREFANSNFQYATVIAGRTNAAAYDGQYAYFYCSHSGVFDRILVNGGFQPYNTLPYLSFNGDDVGLIINRQLIVMYPNCQIKGGANL